ncbi:prolyl oligopeptidase family serine peptidase [Rhizobiales bacterium RZME27]|uniref:prolyl oligopeptidase n=1 Tax=Endobacterium cereale TaxID=2663029 RepID=A0A6A8A1P7_9HYPH|nr:prolyl oligopeptidase family serine peptidase [Endobacterium cereale]MEB2848553.1 prolyl oligopeptidase family serine peptidase [Endobacterium cereale]MQY44489.1 prolyl oligopeptidase family serine peptidase [Endobacterium cereale]
MEDNLQKIIYPKTERIDVTEEHFGRTVVDSYRWLENDAPDDRAVSAWIEAQNALTQKHLEALPGRDHFRKRMTELLDYDRYTVPRKRGDRYFFNFIKGNENQPSLYVRDGVFGESRVLIDPNTWSPDGADALTDWSVSDDARYVAFGVQEGGTDWRTIKVLNVESGKELADSLDGARFTRLAWAPDGSGFFYSRMPRPAQGSGRGAVVANHAVYFHKLGKQQADDRLIYATPDRPDLLHGADRVSGGRYLTISSTPGTNESTLTVIDLQARNWTPKTVVPDMESSWYVLGNHGTELLLATTLGAERARIVSLDMAAAKPEPKEIIPEAADGAVLDAAVIAGDTLLVSYQIDVKTEIRRFTLDGKPDGTVDLPGVGTARFLEGDAREAFFVFTSYDAPIAIYHYDIASKKVTPWAEPKVPIDLESLHVDQRFYRSKDGTEVPLFLIRRKDITAAAPTLLYGYGGFGLSQIPIYNPIQLAWVEQGGVLAVANIRGGGEYGRAWHRAGQLENKQNSFDDFIAAAEFLKRTGITSPDGLAIQGESNGGLLVAAVTNQRPDLFDVALPGVAVTDMLRYEQFTGGGLWKGEFGSPAEEKHFRNLITYSPYHTIRKGTDYPAILAPTADADDRVVPAHTFKYIAALQATDLGPKPRLMRVETRAGHGAGMPIDKVIAQHADMWAFAAYWTGLKTTLPK